MPHQNYRERYVFFMSSFVSGSFFPAKHPMISQGILNQQLCHYYRWNFENAARGKNLIFYLGYRYEYKGMLNYFRRL